MFITYDAATRQIRSTVDVADAAAYRLIMSQQDDPWVEVPLLPGLPGECWVDDDGMVRLAAPMGAQLTDQVFDEETPMPSIPDLPDHAVVEPAPGTILRSGTTQVRVTAVGHVPLYGNMTVVTQADKRAVLVASARNARWNLEQLGAPFRGLRLATDDRCKTMIASSMTVADIMERRTGDKWSTNWSFNDGKLRVTRPDLDDMALTIGVYVGRIFAACDSIEDRIESGSITSTSEIDAAFSAYLSQPAPT